MTSTPHSPVRGIFTIAAAQIVSSVGAALVLVLLPRYLDDVSLGRLAFALALTQLLAVAAELGTGTYLTKQIAREPGRARDLVTNALLLRVPLAALAGAFAVFLAYVAAVDPVTRTLVAVLAAVVGLTAVGSIVMGAFQGLQRMKLLGAYMVITRLSYAALVLIFLSTGHGVIGVAAASMFSVLLGLAVMVPVLLRTLGGLGGASFSCGKLVLAGGLPFFVWQAALMVYGQVDALLLAILTRDAVVGWYSAAYRLVAMPIIVPMIVGTALFPALSASAASDRDSFNVITRRALHVVVLICLPLTVGMMVLPGSIVGTLGYDAEFHNSVAPLALLAPCVTLTAVNMIVGTALGACDRQRQWAITAVMAAALNPVLNLIAIPATQQAFGNGATGAAGATTLTEIFMLGAGLWLLPRAVFDRPTRQAAIRICAAAAVVVPVLLLARSLPIVVPIILGGLVYGGACLALGAIRVSDVKRIRLELTGRAAVASG